MLNFLGLIKITFPYKSPLSVRHMNEDDKASQCSLKTNLYRDLLKVI